MRQARLIWVNCRSFPEANRIGRSLLTDRLAACIDILSGRSSLYFWPPRKGRIKRDLIGTVLLATSRPGLVRKAIERIRQVHKDRVPFIGILTIQVSDDYGRWLTGELRKN